jgi:CubicO group peptidase (beta-lactamase class C family)
VSRSAYIRLSLAASLAVVLALRGPASEAQSDPAIAAKVDQVFSRWTDRTPGCAVGVGVGGRSVLEKAYGMADLEHDVKNTAETIFEAGSVSKQFTAAAVLLLAREGKLSLDDPVRKYVPELPDYGAPLTIRHMLNHTSGLRDWGSVAAVAGWPRTTRVHTHAHVLDIVSRQRTLNFPSGTRYSYSNTGYNLSAIIVSRVSGESFAEFTRKRVFEPVGMANTSWRDDYTRIVKNRAIAYADSRDGFRLDMPFENVHGNGGLLTTVGDMLRWTAHFGQAKLGDVSFVKEQQQPGRFNDGRQHQYALGLRVAPYKGVREVGHSGSTAGYRAHLAYFPDQGVSVGVLCNVSSGNATQYAHNVADLYLGPALTSSPAQRATSPRYELKTIEADAVVGLYRNTETGEPLRIVKDGAGLRVEAGSGTQTRIAVQAESGTRFSASNGRRIEIDGTRLRLIDQFGSVDPHERVPDSEVQPRPLTEYAGTFVSDEAEVTYIAEVQDGALVLKRRPDSAIRFRALYADAFQGPLGFLRFHRDATGKVSGFSVSQDRVWDLRFTRVGQPGTR